MRVFGIAKDLLFGLFFIKSFVTNGLHSIGGGERGIRTLGRLLTYTRFPGVRLKPLIHLSEYNDTAFGVYVVVNFFCTQKSLTEIWPKSQPFGGDGGIRTLDAVLAACSLSRGVPSTTRPRLLLQSHFRKYHLLE